MIKIILLLSIASLFPVLFAQTCHTKIPHYTPTSQFKILADEAFVLDKKTGLIWQRCALGQYWVNGRCKGGAKEYTFTEAGKVAKSANDAGFNDWRVPTITELASIVDLACYNPAINIAIFPDTNSTWYWSSSPYVDNPSNAWVINFKYGNDSHDERKNGYPVRLVRAGQ